MGRSLAAGDEAPGAHEGEGLWNPTVIPLLLAILMFPMLNLKSITFFTKFNSLGVFSIAYLLFFVVFCTLFYKDDTAAQMPYGGYNLPHDLAQNWGKPGVFSLMGVLSLSFFIHNGVLSIMRNSSNPSNNVRDLSVAYICVCLTYMLVGVAFFIAFKPKPGLERTDYKSCMSQNFLLDFEPSDVGYPLVVVLMIMLLLQFITVFPLLCYIIRFQALTMLYNGNPWPSLKHVIALNLLLVVGCVVVTELDVQIGVLLKYLGAGCGLVYVFIMPLAVDRKIAINSGDYGIRKQLVFWFFCLFGVVNLAGQLIPSAVHNATACKPS